MLPLDEAAALLQRVDVPLARDIVLDPDRHDQDEADHEREADEIMCVFRGLREARERLRADHRQEQHLAESDVEAGEAKNYERHGRKPMREPLESGEAVHLP